MKCSWLYVLQCGDKTYYTGCTTNLEQRVLEHQSGKHEGYTLSRLPVKLVYSQEFTHINDAIAMERKIKKWSQAKKEALINGNFDKIKKLAKKQF
ncbi:MAG: GIY-YIG nuclease family protein [Fibrobacteria bacterium]|nr:GIY-YIG nuclease family protein [Fibrobacteria bacterium]